MLKRWLFLLIILAFGINLAILRWMYLSSEHIPNIDGISNLIEARSLAKGYGKEATNNPFWPYVVSWVYRLLGDVELAGRLVSVLFGSLLGLPVFFLARSLYGERIGLLSAALAIFYPNLQRFNQEPAETNAFLFFLTLGFYGGWITFGDAGMRRHKDAETQRHGDRETRGCGDVEACCEVEMPRRWLYHKLGYFTTGLLLGLSYLIRPEALAYWPVFAVWIFFSKRESSAARLPVSPCPRVFVSLPPIGLFLSGIGIVMIGYLFFLHHYYNRWTPLPQGIPRIIATEAVIPQAYEELYYGLVDNKTLGEGAAQEGALHFLVTNLIQNPVSLWTVYRFNLNQLLNLITPSFEVPHKVLSPILALLILAGFLLKGKRNREDFKKELYLLTTFAPLPGQLLYMIQEGVCSYFLPALIIWGGRGIGVLADQFEEIISRRIPPQKARSWTPVFLCTFVGLIISTFVIRSPLITLARSPMASLIIPPSPEERFSRSGFEEPIELKEVGKWLQRHGRPDPRIMERKSVVAFYAEGTNVGIPYAEYSEILQYAERVRADYLVVDQRFVGSVRPSPQFLLDEKNSPKELKLIVQYPFPKVLVYEFCP